MAQNISLNTQNLIGREEELSLIVQAYHAAQSGQLNVVLLTGDLGVGKTRLLEAFVAYAASAGAIIMRGDFCALEGMPPYFPFLKALGEYVRSASTEELRQYTHYSSDILVSILPELAARLEEFSVQYPQAPDPAPLRLYAAIGSLLESISASSVLVFTLDDLHWADRASLDLLCYLTQQHTRARVLILGTYRAGEIDDNALLERTVAELARQRVLTTITIPRLTCPQTTMLATNRLHAPVAPVVGKLLCRQSEGNPFFAEELLQSWIEMKAIALENNRWIAVAPLEQTLPASIVGALRQRFTRFTPTTIDHLRIAAIIGQAFKLSILAQIVGQDVETVEEHLIEAVRARFIHSSQSDLFVFNHDMVREILYAEVSISRRRRIHEKIGLALEALYNQGAIRSMRELAELAFHFSRSGDAARGAAYSRQAAQQAMLTSAPEEALLYYRMVLDQLGPDDEQCEAVLLELGQAASAVEARETPDAFGDIFPTDILPQAAITVSLAAQAIATDDTHRAEQLYQQLLVFRGQRHWFLVDRFLGELALLCDNEAARVHLREAEQIAQREGLHAEMARILLDKSACEQRFQEDGFQERALTYLNEALRLFEVLHLQGAVEHVHQRQQELLSQPDPASVASAPLPASLTQREVKILRLVAAGKSNYQIAEALHLSQKTVANHLTHIFNKTSCENRAAATAFAIRHGLV